MINHQSDFFFFFGQIPMMESPITLVQSLQMQMEWSVGKWLFFPVLVWINGPKSSLFIAH